MRKIRKLGTTMLLLILTAFTVCSCDIQRFLPTAEEEETPSVPSQKEQDNNEDAAVAGSLRIGVLDMPKTLEPTEYEQGVCLVKYGIAETLFRFNDSMGVNTWIASGYEVVNETDLKIYLNANASFSDGTKADAQAVIKSLKRTAAKEGDSSLLANAAYEVIDEATFTIGNISSGSGLISYLCMPQTAIVKETKKGLLYTGIYQIDQFKAGESLILTANGSYWNGEPKFPGIAVKTYKDASALSQAFEANETDICEDIQPGSTGILSGTRARQVISRTSDNVYLLYLNVKHMDNENLRLAVQSALDNEMVCQGLDETFYDSSGNPFSYTYDWNLPEDDASPAEILSAEGYQMGKDQVLQKNGKKLSLTLLCDGSVIQNLLAENIKSQLQNAGIMVKVKEGDVKTDDYDMAIGYLENRYYEDMQKFVEDLFAKDGQYNYAHFYNWDIQHYIGELQESRDPMGEGELYQSILTQAQQSNAYRFLANRRNVMIADERLDSISEDSLAEFYLINLSTEFR